MSSTPLADAMDRLGSAVSRLARPDRTVDALVRVSRDFWYAGHKDFSIRALDGVTEHIMSGRFGPLKETH